MIHSVYRRILWREYLAWALVFTLISCLWLVKTGVPGFVYVFWVKAAGFLAIMAYIYFWRRRYLYVFYNRSIRRHHLLLYVLIADLIISTPFWAIAMLLHTIDNQII